jgi:hypothetical protein
VRSALADPHAPKTGRPLWWAAGLSLFLVIAGLVVLRPWSDSQNIEVPPPQRADREQRAAWAADALRHLVDAVDGGPDQGLSELDRTVVTNARTLKVQDFSLRYVDEDDGALVGSDTWVADVAATWQLAGFDPTPASTEVSFTFRQEGQSAVIESIGGHGRRSPLWLAGPVAVRRSADALVIAQGGDAAADRYFGLAKRAVPIVQRVLSDWRGGLVVEVASSASGLDQELDADPGEYAQIAAVTTTSDGTTGRRSPVHVFVNPEVFGGLLPTGAQVVMSHEATHVATHAIATAMPLWLVEGFADYVALRDVHLPLSRTAGQIAAVVRRDGAPTHLPTDDEFGTRTTHLGAQYEAAWLACRTLAELGGESRLVALYRAMAAGGELDAELRQIFGFSEASFTATWRQRLRDLAG